ncbi:uncharacterized protein CYBJADRAFT_168520 [Cyberlindnera jadinii NRRL Y-1542]|uniref:Uncharacterized protein n=1 Tax=Cyberlindnera jadinii (strain ATCC 18201 / CBS 1600 / BCRC 20928 / JCM 3617 / NBRC 0987 / NRRL Y-1542) TaxID=983966 RepID=A0A1E4RZB7_CYBJN|nr:hypothetical protein CYBJADRAFT_168520 [Cyberlindnera jadinii NRRL Y-1542]ODV72599.1 hypothetical protein CYBJADRAFT_168520 [Cyberlindnera jadinii NRRL Y-1542]
MSLTILLRIGTLLFLSVKLLTDASFPLTIQGFTGSNFSYTQTETTLVAVLMLLMAFTDMAPLLESNVKYFKSISRTRLVFFVAIHIVSSSRIIPGLSGDLISYYAILEEVFNASIITEFIST